MSAAKPTTLIVGDIVQMKHGPFRSSWRVVRVTEAGAELDWVGDVAWEGWQDILRAPNGDQLTSHPSREFIGRAHWYTATVIDKPSRR